MGGVLNLEAALSKEASTFFCPQPVQVYLGVPHSHRQDFTEEITSNTAATKATFEEEAHLSEDARV